MKVVVVMVALVGCSEERVLSQPCDGFECVVTVHERGIADEASDNFHGKLLARTNWDFNQCASCHGEDFAGGTSGVSCITCHREGPTACTTCHRDESGSRTASASHAGHRAAQLDCAECHRVPDRWDAPGHIVDDSAPAEVTFGARAAITVAAADRAGPPTWDGSTCSNVYCHGAAMPGGGTTTRPTWNASVTCGSCHASPPPSHARNDCATCHPSGAPHVDGTLQIGASNDCSGCHGSATSPAPPRDLAGNTLTTAIGVGAHQAHLQPGLRAPIACETCHAVPATVTAVGHLDAAPAEVNVALGWNRTTQTCTTWCHGTAQPGWTSHGDVVCGSCHAVPPSDSNHNAQMTTATCATCHAWSKHMNGVVDGL